MVIPSTKTLNVGGEGLGGAVRKGEDRVNRGQGETSLEDFWLSSTTSLSHSKALVSTWSPEDSTTPSRSIYDFVVDLDAPALISRCTLDGRTCGPVRRPLESSIELFKPPLSIVEAVKARFTTTSSSSSSMTESNSSLSTAAATSQLVLAVPMDEEDEEDYNRQQHSLSHKRSHQTSKRTASSAAVQFRLLNSICVSFPMRADKPRLQLQLFSNLIERSRKALLVGFDPLACYLRSLRSSRYENGKAIFFIDTMRPEAGIGVRIEDDEIRNTLSANREDRSNGTKSQSLSRFAISCAKEGAGFVKGVTLN
jgi:hypothetical protein